jgi:hypothetical protein
LLITAEDGCFLSLVTRGCYHETTRYRHNRK